MNSIFKKIFFKKIFSKFLVSLLFLTFSLNAYSDDLFIPLIDKADRARVEFNDLYEYFLEQDPEVFKDANQDLTESFKLKPNITGRILENGPVLLNLICWLDKNKKDDAVGLLLLRKLNRFLYLEFRHFVGHLNVNKKYEGRLVGLLHNFYKFKVPAKAGSTEEKLKFEFPFQAAISKAMLFILIVNASSLDYDEKVENVAYFLDKIRRELLEIKSRYADDCNLRTAHVNDFVELLQTYATKEPILGPNYMKRIIIIITIIAAIALVVWLAWDNVVRGQIDTEIKKAWNVCSDAFGNLVELLGGRLAKGGLEYIGSEQGQAEIEKCTQTVEDKGVKFVARALNQLHDSEARIIPGCPIVPHRIADQSQCEDRIIASPIIPARDDVSSSARPGWHWPWPFRGK